MSLSDPTIVILAEDLSIQAAAALKEELVNLKTSAVQINAESVTHIDAPCAQLLAAFSAHHTKSNISFEIVKESSAFREGLSTLGLDTTLPCVAR